MISVAGPDTGWEEEEGTLSVSTVRMSISEDFLGLGAILRGFLVELPGADI